MYKIKKENWCSQSCKYKLAGVFSKKIHREKKPICTRFKVNSFSSNEDFPVIEEKWNKIFKDNFDTIELPNKSVNGLVIVENRCDERLEFVIKNIIYYIPNWKLHIYHSEKNKTFIQKILGKHTENVVLHNLEHDIQTNQDYNKVLLDVNFWKKLMEHERVLIFQTDTIMLRSGIEKFLKYDYIGAPWEWWFEDFKTYNRMGGNGGFSLRNVSKMIETITKYKGVEKVQMRDYQNEDIFFSYHLFEDKNAILPNWNDAMLFSSEVMLCAKTLAVHQAWRFHEKFIPAFTLKKKNTK